MAITASGQPEDNSDDDASNTSFTTSRGPFILASVILLPPTVRIDSTRNVYLSDSLILEAAHTATRTTDSDPQLTIIYVQLHSLGPI